jgi:uncharacterized iron-regulated membrane protein
MKLFRSILFWTHLTAGVLTSVVILVMSFTGVVLALKPQIQEWIERDVRSVEPAGVPRLGVHQLLTAVQTAKPETPPQSLTLSREPDVAAAVGLGRDGNVYVNPYTGAILGSGSAKTTQFFQSMTAWHRYMGATGDSRAMGRSATGISNLAFLLLAVTGLYIWWPKQLSLRYVKPIVWFRSTSTGRAREFNWHNTIGFWCLIPIVIMTVSGAVISYPWASNLVYRVTGSPIPAPRGGGPGAAGGAAGRGGPQAEGRGGPAQETGRGARPEAVSSGNGEQQARARGRGQNGPGRGAEAAVREGGSRPAPGAAGDAAAREGGPQRPGGGEQNQPPAIIPADLDTVWARAEQQVPTWSVLSMRLPNRDGAPVAFTITDGANWNAFARSNLTLNSATAEVVQWQPYEASNLGQKARGWLRFAHTGELGGLTGQIIAGLGCLGGVFLVYTGLSLAFRRLWNWALWKRLGAARRDPVGARSATAGGEVAREALMGREG